MKIEIKTSHNKSGNSFTFTPIDDYLLDRLISDSFDFIIDRSQSEVHDDITLEVNSTAYKLFESPQPTSKEKNYFPFLFAFQKMDWYGKHWYQNPIIEKFFIQISNNSAKNGEALERKSTLTKTNIIGIASDQNKLFGDLDSKLERLKIGRDAIEFELRQKEKELKKCLETKNQISAYYELKKNLIKLKDEVDTYDNQLSVINEDLEEMQKLKKPLENEADKLRSLKEEKTKKLEQFQSLTHNEKFARTQMSELDIELNTTNSQGLEYISKLESIEKKIFDIDQSLGQINDTRIPGHVIKKINEYNDVLRDYLNQLGKIEFILKQTEEFEKSIADLKEQQHKIGQPDDLSDNIKKLEMQINEIDLELERIKGREESLIEGEKLLSNSICPIIEKTCTTIDEPVEDFFKRKLATVNVDRSRLIQRRAKLEKQISNKRKDQELYFQWSALQTKIFHTMDIQMEAFNDFNAEEKILNDIPIGEEALIVISLLENLFPAEIIGKFQKSFLRMGQTISSSNLKKKVATYRKNIIEFEEEWKSVFHHFREIIKKNDMEDDLLLQKREQYTNQKNQMRKEYSIICQQVESIERRRKDLSKLLFEAGEASQLGERLEELDIQIEQVTENVKKHQKIVSKEKENLYKREFLEGHLHGIIDTEKKYQKELKGMKKKLNLDAADHLDEKIASLNRNNEALVGEIKIIDNRINNIELQKKDILFFDQKNTSKKKSKKKSISQPIDIKKTAEDKNFISEKDLSAFLADIQLKTDLTLAEYNRRFPSPMPENETIALEKITKIRLLMNYIPEENKLPLAIVTKADDLFWWHELAKSRIIFLLCAKSLKKQAKMFS